MRTSISLAGLALTLMSCAAQPYSPPAPDVVVPSFDGVACNEGWCQCPEDAETWFDPAAVSGETSRDERCAIAEVGVSEPLCNNGWCRCPDNMEIWYDPSSSGATGIEVRCGTPDPDPDPDPEELTCNMGWCRCPSDADTWFDPSAMAGDTSHAERCGTEGGDPTPAPRPMTATRPPENTGTGFFTSGGSIYDANGELFVARGVNITPAWGRLDHNRESLSIISRSSANLVRIAVGDFIPGRVDTPEAIRTLVERGIENRLVVMPEWHSVTGGVDPAELTRVTDFWLLPENVTWLRANERQIMLNIANEWGDRDDPVAWRDAYIDSITRLRAAGVNALIVVDSTLYGQSPTAILNHGAAIIEADPQHNVAFSIHMYRFWRTVDDADDVASWPHGPWSVETELGNIDAAGLPLMIGEFGAPTSPETAFSTQTLMDICGERSIGWIAWAWKETAGADQHHDMLRIANTFDADADLTDFGRLVLDHPAGTRATSRVPEIF